MTDLELEMRKRVRDIPDFPKPGILFKDITPLLLHPLLCKKMINVLSNKYESTKIDAVAGIESRGFLWGPMLALALDVPFIPIRKKGKLPYNTYSQSYELEYGHAVLEMHTDAVKTGMKVLIHDDVLATGGTAIAASKLLKKAGANLAGYCFIIELEFLSGRLNLFDFSNQVSSLVSYQ